MRGGALRNIITIQRQVQIGVTDIGEPNFVWQDWRPELFCEVEVRRGREHFESQQRYSEEVWRFRVRFDEVVGLDTSMRVLHEGNVFDIKAPLPDGQRHDDVIIECTVQDSFLREAALSIGIATRIYPGTVGETYVGFSASPAGGKGPWSVTIDSGALPPGLALDVSTGAIYGVPTSAGNYPFVLKVTDAAGEVAKLPQITITVDS